MLWRGLQLLGQGVRGIGRGVATGARGVRTAYRALAAGSPRAWDVLAWTVTAVFFVIAWSTLPITHQVDPPLMPVVAAVGVAPLLLARAHAFLGWGVWVAGAALIPAVFPLREGYAWPWPVPAFLVLLLLVLAVARTTGSWRRLAVTFGGTAALLVVATALAGVGVVGFGWVFGVAAVMGFGVLLRRLAASRRELAKQEEEKELERARRAVAEERSRIARDLHDVVAHRMSLVVVQAQSAQYRLGGVTPEVAEEFRLVAEQAREALNEVRGMLGVLRSDGQLAEQVPQPGTEDVERLLGQARQAGLPLRWQITGDPAGCGPATAMVLYRVLQESLANASRHAPGAPVQVVLEYGAPVRLRIVNAPAPGAGASRSEHRGHGIPGMQARAESVGGELAAGPTPDGGFEVRAELPARAPGGADLE